MLAQESGRSLSGWMRRAALKRADELERSGRLDSVDALERFFAECDALDRSDESEPDWERSKQAIADSRTRGLPRE